MAPAEQASRDLLTSLLRDVSRSFYLTLRALPAAIRPQISLAYLLARATDTLADTELLPASERLAALDQLRARILGETTARLDFARFTAVPVLPAQSLSPADTGPASPRTAAAERALLSRIEDALAVLAGFPPDDRQRLREVLATITSGQALDLRRFAGATTSPAGASPTILALQTDAELDDYTYRVAGCVGEFWTRMCRAHLFPEAPLDDAVLLADAVRFGKGLQLVNILRDVPADLRRGRCYLPADRLQAAGLTPVDLLDPASEPKLRPLYDGYLGVAAAHLAAGWAYTNTLPRGQVRVRLAGAWPILIGARTLARLRGGQVLDPARRIKVTRAEVRGLIARSVLAYPWPKRWNGLFANAGKAGRN